MTKLVHTIYAPDDVDWARKHNPLRYAEMMTAEAELLEAKALSAAEQAEGFRKAAVLPFPIEGSHVRLLKPKTCPYYGTVVAAGEIGRVDETQLDGYRPNITVYFDHVRHKDPSLEGFDCEGVSITWEEIGVENVLHDFYTDTTKA